jgi:hypothetical protein
VNEPAADLARAGASLEEAAAALAAIERFLADRAAPASRAAATDAWTRAARLAAVGEVDCGARAADSHPWGRSPH